MRGRQEGQGQRRGDLRSRGQRERSEEAVQAEGEISQGVVGSLEDARTQSSLEPPEGMQSRRHLDSCPGRRRLETWPPEHEDDEAVSL